MAGAARAKGHPGGERDHAVIEEIGRGDRRLAMVELGEGDFGVGVDKGLLVDASHPLQV